MRNDSGAKTKLFNLQRGTRGIVQTLKIMQSLVDRYKTNIKIRELAQKIINRVPEKNCKLEAATLQNWVRDNIRYTKDIAGVETIGSPDHTLLTRHGDCDDQSILLATLLQSVGHPTRFAAVGNHKNKYNHVYTEVKINGQWLPAETTENWQLGEPPPVIKSKMILDNGKITTNLTGLDMQDFAQRESQLDKEFEKLAINASLSDQVDGLGFHKKFRRRIKKLKKVVRKVVKVAAVAAAVYFTGGAALALVAKAKAAKQAAKVAATRQERENAEIEAENAIVAAQQAQYDQEIAQQQKAQIDASQMLIKEGIKMDSPQAQRFLSKAVQLETDKLNSGAPVSPAGKFKKLLPAAAIAIPLIIAAAV